MDDIEEGEAVDIGRLRDLHGLGGEGTGVATRDELQAVMTGKVWDGGCLDKASAAVYIEEIAQSRCTRRPDVAV